MAHVEYILQKYIFFKIRNGILHSFDPTIMSAYQSLYIFLLLRLKLLLTKIMYVVS